MEKKCICCGFEADDEEFDFGIWQGQTFCGNCIEVKHAK